MLKQIRMCIKNNYPRIIFISEKFLENVITNCMISSIKSFILELKTSYLLSWKFSLLQHSFNCFIISSGAFSHPLFTSVPSEYGILIIIIIKYDISSKFFISFNFKFIFNTKNYKLGQLQNGVILNNSCRAICIIYIFFNNFFRIMN